MCFLVRRSGHRRIASRPALAASCRLAAVPVSRPVSDAPSPSHAAQAATADHSLDTRYYWFASSRWHPALQIKSARSSFALSRISDAVKQAQTHPRNTTSDGNVPAYLLSRFRKMRLTARPIRAKVACAITKHSQSATKPAQT
jgi:hypothetical protein